MPQVCFSADKELIEQLNELAKRQNKSRSEMIKLLLKSTVPVALGKVPLREGVPTPTERRLQDLERRVESLEKLGVKVTFLSENDEAKARRLAKSGREASR